MFYKPEGLDLEGYIYYPSNSSTRTTLVRYNADQLTPRPVKYISRNEVKLEKDFENIFEKAESTMPHSCYFSDCADDFIDILHGPSSEIGGSKALLFEDSMIHAYERKDRENEAGHTLFKGVQYPTFETTEENVLIKGKLFNEINRYFVCVITIETKFGDAEIDWSLELWGIDHFE